MKYLEFSACHLMMRQVKIVFAFALFIVVSFAVSAQPTNLPSANPSNPLRAMPFAPPPPLPAGILAWDAISKTVEATNGQGVARLFYNFTNVSPNGVTILSARPSCGCTTVEMPPVPWLVAAGSTGQIKLNVNLSGKAGALFKSVNLTTDQGSQRLEL